ncbi:hypothetical protein [Aquimarina sp. I32.4]|uniref:hypothetical protein n=1 Tax=Aquimarina sp. I32.4 TaxID=2053903 RepID=UPI000CDF2810|nr:hypothetical protein [Aquimarina sp. I32.4]
MLVRIFALILICTIANSFAQEHSYSTMSRDELIKPFKEQSFEQLKETLNKTLKRGKRRYQKINKLSEIIVDYSGDSHYKQKNVLKILPDNILEKYARSYLNSFSFTQELKEGIQGSKLILSPNQALRDTLALYTNIDETSLSILLDTIQYANAIIEKKKYHLDRHNLSTTIEKNKNITLCKGIGKLNVCGMNVVSTSKSYKELQIDNKPVFALKQENAVRLLVPLKMKDQIIAVQAKDKTGKTLKNKDINIEKALSPKATRLFKKITKIFEESIKKIEQKKLTTQEEVIFFLEQKFPKKITIDHYYAINHSFYGTITSYEIFIKDRTCNTISENITIHKSKTN